MRDDRRDLGASADADRALAVPAEPEVSALRASLPSAMKLALIPFIEAARHASEVHSAVIDADLRGRRLGRGFEAIYAAVNCAQSIVSWADWRELLAAWDAIGKANATLIVEAINALPDLLTALEAPSQPVEDEVERVARAIHVARLAPGKAPKAWPLGVHFTERDYCRSLARAAIAAMHRPVEIEGLVEALRKLGREYRSTMDADVLHSWAGDVVAALSSIGVSDGNNELGGVTPSSRGRSAAPAGLSRSAASQAEPADTNAEGRQ